MSRKKKGKGIWWLLYVWGLLFIGCWWIADSFLLGACYFVIIFCVYALIFMLCASVLYDDRHNADDKQTESYETSSIYDPDLNDEDDFADEAECGDADGDDVDSDVEDGEINWTDNDDDNYTDNYFDDVKDIDPMIYRDNFKLPWE